MLHKSLPSACVCICIPSIVARQRFGKHVHAATNTSNNRRTVGRFVFYAVRVVSNESLWVCLCIPLSLVGNNSVKMFPRQRRIVGGVVFYAVHVVSRESRFLVLPKFLAFNSPPSIRNMSVLPPPRVVISSSLI
jgi:hypothetical protein